MNTDAFASTTELRQLLASESEIIAGMEEYIAAEEERIQELKEYVSQLLSYTPLTKHDNDIKPDNQIKKDEMESKYLALFPPSHLSQKRRGEQ